MQSFHWLDIAFVLGLITQSTKLGELILLPKQQEKLQNKVELLALRIDAINPLNWYKIIKDKTAIGVITIIFAGILNLLTLGVLDTSQISSKELIVYASFVVLTSLSSYYFYKKFGPLLIDYLLANGIFLKFFRRFLLIILIFWVAVTIFFVFIAVILSTVPNLEQNLTYIFDKDIFSLTSFAIIIPVCVLFGLSNFISGFIYVGIIIIIYQLFLIIALFLVKVAKSIVWRVASFNKGAVAAITLIITVAIGIIELVMRAKP
ncbi:MAG: hypothetical protein JWQ09_642 [Segetibacter sp.]|nr:hypothetical protein [Segetibacter sp.]